MTATSLVSPEDLPGLGKWCALLHLFLGLAMDFFKGIYHITAYDVNTIGRAKGCCEYADQKKTITVTYNQRKTSFSCQDQGCFWLYFFTVGTTKSNRLQTLLIKIQKLWSGFIGRARSVLCTPQHNHVREVDARTLH